MTMATPPPTGHQPTASVEVDSKVRGFRGLCLLNSPHLQPIPAPMLLTEL